MRFLGRIARAPVDRVVAIANHGRWGVLPHYVFGLVVILIFVFMAYLPIGRLLEETGKEREIRKKIEAIREEDARIRREIESLEDPLVVESMARARLGFVRPGEVSFIPVEGELPPPPAGPPPRRPKAASPAKTPTPVPAKSPTPAKTVTPSPMKTPTAVKTSTPAKSPTPVRR